MLVPWVFAGPSGEESCVNWIWCPQFLEDQLRISDGEGRWVSEGGRKRVSLSIVVSFMQVCHMIMWNKLEFSNSYYPHQWSCNWSIHSNCWLVSRWITTCLALDVGRDWCFVLPFLGGRATPTANLYHDQGCHFSGISLISWKSEVPFQGNSHLFRVKDMYTSKNLVKKVFLGASDCTKLISRLKTFSGGQLVPLIFRKKHF